MSPGYFGFTEGEMEFPQPQEVSRTQFHMKKRKQEKTPLGRRTPSSNVAIGSGGCLQCRPGTDSLVHVAQNLPTSRTCKNGEKLFCLPVTTKFSA